VSAVGEGPARVVLLCGPSGSGKTRIATRSGLPVFRLDDFYKDLDDPSLPLSAELGIPDWDDVRAWHSDRAVDALETACRDGRVEVPTYDIGLSRATGTTLFETHGAAVMVAEGVFAADVIEALRERGILADAVVLTRAPWKNFVRRFARDLAERRKPPRTLWQRGRMLMGVEPAMVATAASKGCRRLDAHGLATLLTVLAHPTSTPT
jgi:uridine kinase